MEKFPLVSFKVLRQYRDGLLTHLLAQVLASNPAQAPVITAEGGGQIEEGERRAAALLKEINESLDLLLPVDDLLGALHDRFPNEPGAALMDAFSDIVLNPDHVSVFDESGPNRRQYSFENVTIIANPAADSVNL